MSSDFTDQEFNDISIIERVGSVLSLIGCIFIIVTFSVSHAFHKPINRLVFYASFGNMMSNVGTLMSREYVDHIDSFGCQFQGFLIQMFLPADALWTLSMAFNVYLTFYYKFDAEKLRKMEIYYFLLCYGLPLVPALTYIFVSNKEQGRMYGNAVLWCWVSSKWDIFRISTFYGPVWVVILLTFFIYIRAGGDIYRKRKQLHNFGSSGTHDADLWIFEDPLAVKTTEVSVTTETIGQGQPGIDLAPLGCRESASGTEGQNAAYSVTISSSKKGDRRSQGPPPPPTPVAGDSQPPLAARNRPKTKRRANYEANNAAWSYTKCALLFFTALLVTWVPSSANRVYSVIHAGQISVPLEMISAVVLPLQGFWNAIIYIVTSWSAVKMFFTDLGRHSRQRPLSTNYPSELNDKRNFAFKLSSRSNNTSYESESMTELAITTDRRSSNEDTKGRAL